MLCGYNFVVNNFYVTFLPAIVALNQKAYLCFRLVCTSGWFMLPVGLYEWKITNGHLILTTMFKNALRTFEAETPKILKDI